MMFSEDKNALSAASFVKRNFDIELKQPFYIKVVQADGSEKYFDDEVYCFTNNGLTSLTNNALTSSELTDMFMILCLYAGKFKLELIKDSNIIGAHYYFVTWDEPGELKITQKINKGDYIDYANNFIKNMFLTKEDALEFGKGLGQFFNRKSEDE